MPENSKNIPTISSQLIWFIGILGLISLYLFTLQSKNDASFILLLAAGVMMLYWIPVITKTLNKNIKIKGKVPNVNIKDWIYDLIPIDGGFLFVADVPEPENEITVRLENDNLKLHASGNFYKEVKIPDSEDMKITSFKYRNGVLTLQIVSEIRDMNV